MINKIYSFNTCIGSTKSQSIQSREGLSYVNQNLQIKSKREKSKIINSKQKQNYNPPKNSESIHESHNHSKITIYQRKACRGKIFHIGRSAFFFQSKFKNKISNQEQLDKDSSGSQKTSIVDQVQQNLSLISFLNTQQYQFGQLQSLNQRPTFVYLNQVDVEDSTTFQSKQGNELMVYKQQKNMDYLKKYLNKKIGERKYKEKQSRVSKDYQLRRLHRFRQSAIVGSQDQNFIKVVINQVTKQSLSSIDSKASSKQSQLSQISLLVW